MSRTEDEVRDEAKKILGFDDDQVEVKQGTGQITTFNQLGFRGENRKPDGWYLPNDKALPAIILETKAESEDILNSEKDVNELAQNCDIVNRTYDQVLGILYNGQDVRVFLNNKEMDDTIGRDIGLQPKGYYLSLLNKNTIDKQHIYKLTKNINEILHSQFGIKNLYHRMIFTACTLVAKRYGADLYKGMNFVLLTASILNTLSKSLEESRKQNLKLDILTEVYSEIKMNSTSNQDAIDKFIEYVSDISDCINSDFWHGEDVMGIFFNEFNRYKGKSESGQVFTPDHITSFMYYLIGVNKNDCVLDAACGSGAFLVKAMSYMMDEAGGPNTRKAKEIKSSQLYGIEWDREIYALACANMLIHKDGKTNIEQMDTRTEEACKWIQSKNITKVLMNPPFERKYGCLKIVKNVLDSVPPRTPCAFILPDKKLEKSKGDARQILKSHRLEKIIKLPEKTFSGVTTSIFIFTSGIPQGDSEIFGCYIPDDGLVTVKNQGRQDVHDNWNRIQTKWLNIIKKQSGDDSIQWIKPCEHLSYQMPEKEFSLSKEDLLKTITDYVLYVNDVDVKELNENIVNKVVYGSEISTDENDIVLKVKVNKDDEQD